MNSSLIWISDLPDSHCTVWTAVCWVSVTCLFQIVQNEQQVAGDQWPVCFTLHRMNSSLLGISDLSVSHCTQWTAVCWGSVTCMFHIAEKEQQSAGGQWPVCFTLHRMKSSLLGVSDLSVSHCTKWTAVCWGSVTCVFHIAQNEQQSAGGQWPIYFTLPQCTALLWGSVTCLFHIEQNKQQFPEGQWPVCFTLHRRNSGFLRVSDLSISNSTEWTAVCWGSVTCVFHIAQNEQQSAGYQWPVCFTLHTVNSSLLRVRDLYVSHCREWTAVCWGSVSSLFHIAQNEQQAAGGQWPVCFTLLKMNSSLLRDSDLSV